VLELLGERQRALLRQLLQRKAGMTVDELSRALEVTRTAVRQHLTALEREGLVALGSSRPSGGRPIRLYRLTAKGQELFPRQYAWLAQLIVSSLKADGGGATLERRLSALGHDVGAQLRAQHPELKTRQQKVERLAELMLELGYDSAATPGAPEIVADNCVFHQLAQRDPAICKFDLALLAAFTESGVELKECMAKGGPACRFRFKPKG
jgi:predicted ArsR family transcriptional regulator